MKKRIWDQLKKAVTVTVLAGIMGNCMISAAEFDAQEFSVPEILLQQSAEWTDRENFQAELQLEVSGLKKLYDDKKEENIQSEDSDINKASDEASVNETEDQISETEDTGEKTEIETETEEHIQQDKVQQSEEIPSVETRYFLTTYISEYFQINESGLKHDMQAETVHIQNRKGEETDIVKLTCEVLKPEENADTFTLKIPVSLRKEYQILPVAEAYPVCQDQPLSKDQDVSGTYFWAKTGEESRILSVTESASLTVPEAKTGIVAELQQETEKVRAGQKMEYTLTIQNTGKLLLENVEISSAFSLDGIKASWETEEGFRVNDGTQGVLDALAPGENRKLQMTLQLAEDQSGELIHTVTVKTKHPGKDESIGCQTSAKLQVETLKAAFEVEKTADRTEAYPGDTITYQICIRNTGERTLHSVLSTERFQNAGIQAKFVQKEGVTINSSGTQAMIPQIAPGEAFALYATVTIPQYFASQELVNEVTVVSDETGTQTMKSQSNVTLTGNTNTVTVTPQPTVSAVQTYEDGNSYASKSAGAYAAASKPRTGDETEIVLYIVMGIFAVMSGFGAFGYLKGKKQH